MSKRLLNIVLLGASRVGKTTMVSQMVEERLPAAYQSAPMATLRTSLTVEGRAYECAITDTPSHDTYTPVRAELIIGTHVFVLVFSVTSRQSFDMVSVMHEKIAEYLYESHIPVVVVGNKRDLVTNREVASEDGVNLSERLGCPYLEVSSLDSKQTRGVLQLCISTLHSRSSSSSSAPTWTFSDLLRPFSQGSGSLRSATTMNPRELHEPPSTSGSFRLSISQTISLTVDSLRPRRALDAISSSLPDITFFREIQAPESKRHSSTGLNGGHGVEDSDIGSGESINESRSSLPTLRGVWSQYQHSSPSTRQSTLVDRDSLLIQMMGDDNPTITVNTEDLLLDPHRFVSSLEELTERRRHSSFMLAGSSDAERDLPRVFLSIASSKELSRALIRLRGDDAQLVIDELQTVLDTEEAPLTRADRARLLYLLLQVSKNSGLYPHTLLLSDITRDDSYPVAAGHFGEIWKGRIRGYQVCLKVLKVYQRSDIERLVKVFAREAIVWSHLKHENVLPFYGIHRLSDGVGRICLVSPWIESGCIRDFLVENPSEDRYSLSRDVCQGLLYLHNHGIVHGDLKGVNVLVTHAGRACVADFGLSSVAETELSNWTSLLSSASSNGTVRWQAPELFDPLLEEAKPTKTSDIYSLGCVLYEIFTGEIPFHEVVREPTVISYVQSGRRPTKPLPTSPPFSAWGLCDDLWDSCIHPCWSRNPQERPTIPFIKTRLDEIERELVALGVLNVQSRVKMRNVSNGWLTPTEVRSMAGHGKVERALTVPRRKQSHGGGGAAGSEDASVGSGWLQWFRSPELRGSKIDPERSL